MSSITPSLPLPLSCPPPLCLDFLPSSRISFGFRSQFLFALDLHFSSLWRCSLFHCSSLLISLPLSHFLPRVTLFLVLSLSSLYCFLFQLFCRFSHVLPLSSIIALPFSKISLGNLCPFLSFSLPIFSLYQLFFLYPAHYSIHIMILKISVFFLFSFPYVFFFISLSLAPRRRSHHLSLPISLLLDFSSLLLTCNISLIFYFSFGTTFSFFLLSWLLPFFLVWISSILSSITSYILILKPFYM